MGETSIEWTARFAPGGGPVLRFPNGRPVTGYTFNGWWGCYKNSPACDNCYAAAWDAYAGGADSHWGMGAPRRFFDHASTHWTDPLRWSAAAARQGIRRNCFAYSMGDWAEPRADLVPHRAHFFLLVQNAPWLDFLTLTKFAGMVPRYITEAGWTPSFPGNIRIGFTGEDQRHFDARWRSIRELAADGWPVFVSDEPLLGRLRLPPDFLELGDRAWMIGGGESGGGARPWELRDALYLRDQCAEADVPFHWKQNGGTNKKLTGRLLDGREYNGTPGPTPAAVLMGEPGLAALLELSGEWDGARKMAAA